MKRETVDVTAAVKMTNYVSRQRSNPDITLHDGFSATLTEVNGLLCHCEQSEITILNNRRRLQIKSSCKQMLSDSNKPKGTNLFRIKEILKVISI